VIRALREENAQLREENARLKAQVADLLALVAKLQARIEILEKASGSGPGGPPLTAGAAEPPIVPKVRGRPPGHAGASWSLPTVEAQVVELELSRCPDCGGRLSPVIDVQEHTVVDLPERIDPVVTTYRHERRYCARCKKTMRAPRAPDEPPQGHFGIRLLTRIAEWKTQVGIPFTKIHALLASVFGIEIPRSTLPSLVQRVGRWLLPVHRRLIEAVKVAPTAHADETSWPVSGKNGWAWLFATKEISVFVMEPTRAAIVPKRILGEHFGGTLVSDDYGVYLDLAEDRQSCWAHVLREAKEVAAVSRAPVAIQLRERLQDIFEDAEIVSAASEGLAPKVLEREIVRIDRRLADLCKGRSNVAGVEHLKNRIARQRRALLTYLRRPGVEPTNNLGERRIRKLVVVRKVSGGSRSWDGARAHGTLASCLDSLAHLKTTFIDLVRAHTTPARRCERFVSVVAV
jgi:transposase